MQVENSMLIMLLEQEKPEKRKALSINIDSGLLQDIDDTVDQIGKSIDRFISRNTFIEVAAKNFLSNLKSELNNINLISGNISQPNNQVIIFTSSEKAGNYYSMFQNNYWESVRLGKEVINLINKGVIKYFALYRSKPLQYIDSYAEIKGIIRLKDGKYKFKLGKIQYLKNNVLLGNAEPSSLMKGRRTTLARLTSVARIDQL